jgi:hypothetical protein
MKKGGMARAWALKGFRWWVEEKGGEGQEVPPETVVTHALGEVPLVQA